MICALPERGVVERDEAFVDDGRFAAVALWGEDLCIVKSDKYIHFSHPRTDGDWKEEETHFVVV